MKPLNVYLPISKEQYETLLALKDQPVVLVQEVYGPQPGFVLRLAERTIGTGLSHAQT